MPNLQPSYNPDLSGLSIGILRPNETKITPLSLTLANATYTHVLQNKLIELIIKSREITKLKVSFIAGDILLNKYFTIEKGNSLFLSDLDFNGKTLYIESTVSNVTVEIFELYNL